MLASAFAQPKSEATITVNLEDGATLKGVVKVVVRVQSERLVKRVEFQVDGALREVDESTPYEYEWDTLTDTEGERRLKIVALVEGGQSVSKELRLVIDNGVGQGALYHYELARNAFAEGKFEDALYHARVALKADSTHRESRVLQTQTLLRLGRTLEADEAVEALARLYPDSSKRKSCAWRRACARAAIATNAPSYATRSTPSTQSISCASKRWATRLHPTLPLRVPCSKLRKGKPQRPSATCWHL